MFGQTINVQEGGGGWCVCVLNFLYRLRHTPKKFLWWVGVGGGWGVLTMLGQTKKSLRVGS